MDPDLAAVFQRRVDAWLAEDVDAYLECWHDDMELTLPGGRVVSGIESYRTLVEQSFVWAAPVSFDVHALATEGDIVFADWTVRARRRADNVVVEWRGLSICQLRDGKITWWREHHLAPPAPVDA
ncbi:MAG: nuclear transport factor 2 family protein [Actinomycetota bacterium]